MINFQPLVELINTLASIGVAIGVPLAGWWFKRRAYLADVEAKIRRVIITCEAAASEVYRIAATEAGDLPAAKALKEALADGERYVKGAIGDTIEELKKAGHKLDIVSMVRARLGDLLAADPNISIGPRPDPAVINVNVPAAPPPVIIERQVEAVTNGDKPVSALSPLPETEEPAAPVEPEKPMDSFEHLKKLADQQPEVLSLGKVLLRA